MAADEARLLELFRRLPPPQAEQLIEFAEFLSTRHGVEPVATAIEPIPRPAQESVVKAIKRLAATYPMLDRRKMLNATATLMAQHVMQGRAAVEVIDELEIVFRRHYEALSLPSGEGGNK